MSRIYQIILIYTILNIYNSVFSAVLPPELSCISVENNGNIKLTWQIPVDPNSEFIEYEIFYSIDKYSGYKSTTINDINTRTYIHNTTNGHINKFYFFVQTKYNEGSGIQNSNSSDTLQTIFLNFQTPPSDTSASFVWNPIINPNSSTNQNQYYIYRKIGHNSWNLIDSVPYGSEIFTNKYKICEDTLIYKVELKNTNGCISNSSLLKYLVQDFTAPSEPKINSLSIKPNGDIILSWNPSEDLDTYGYYIIYYDKISFQNIIIDTISGRTNNLYENTQISGNDGPQKFLVAAFDSCFKKNSSTSNTSPSKNGHTSIYISGTRNNCQKKNILNFTPYLGWSNISYYEIYYSTDGGTFQLLTRLGINDTTFTHFDINKNINYCYYVIGSKVKNGTLTQSFSNTICLKSNLSNNTSANKYLHILNTSIENNQKVIIDFATNKNKSIASYNLEKSIEKLGPFYIVNSLEISNTNINDLFLTIIDNNTKINQAPYYYRISSVDTCGFNIATSPVSNTLFVYGEKNIDTYNNKIYWNNYTTWDSIKSNVKNYEVFRSTKNSNFESIALLDKNTHFYTDDISNIQESNENICYYIKAIETEGNSFNIESESKSNIKCFSYQYKIFIPNAFFIRSNRKNKIFKPVISFVSIQNYSFSIYNRFGNRIFYSTDISKGWNGKYNGKYVINGLYIYKIVFKDSYNNSITKTGKFVVLQ